MHFLRRSCFLRTRVSTLSVVVVKVKISGEDEMLRATTHARPPKTESLRASVCAKRTIVVWSSRDVRHAVPVLFATLLEHCLLSRATCPIQIVPSDKTRIQNDTKMILDNQVGSIFQIAVIIPQAKMGSDRCALQGSPGYAPSKQIETPQAPSPCTRAQDPHGS